jgi:hypothetical protein
MTKKDSVVYAFVNTFTKEAYVNECLSEHMHMPHTIFYRCTFGFSFEVIARNLSKRAACMMKKDERERLQAKGYKIVSRKRPLLDITDKAFYSIPTPSVEEMLKVPYKTLLSDMEVGVLQAFELELSKVSAYVPSKVFKTILDVITSKTAFASSAV